MICCDNFVGVFLFKKQSLSCEITQQFVFQGAVPFLYDDIVFSGTVPFLCDLTDVCFFFAGAVPFL